MEYTRISIVEKRVRSYLWFIHGNICTSSDEDCCNTLSFLILSSQHVFLHLVFLYETHFINFGCPGRANRNSYYMTDSCSLNLRLHSFLQKKDQLHFLFLNLSELLQNISFIIILKCNCQRKLSTKISA